LWRLEAAGRRVKDFLLEIMSRNFLHITENIEGQSFLHILARGGELTDSSSTEAKQRSTWGLKGFIAFSVDGMN
jgi:hypothetical protein